MLDGTKKTTGAWWAMSSGTSWSWSAAQNLYNNLIERERGYVLSNVNQLAPSDVLMYRSPGKNMAHAMVVTKVVGGVLYLTYHTTDRLDYSFTSLKNAVGSSIQFVPIRTRLDMITRD